MLTDSSPPPRVHERVQDAYRRGLERGKAAALAEFETLSAEQKKAWLRENRANVRIARASIRESEAEIRSLQMCLDVARPYSDWVDAGEFELEKPTGDCLHHLREALARKMCVDIGNRKNFIANEAEFGPLLAQAESFVIEHNWAAAFANAQDFDGSFRLPYDICAFQFRISGVRVVALATNYSEVTDAENVVIMQACVEGGPGWMVDRPRWCKNGAWDGDLSREVALVGEQIKAACVALDAAVAETTPIRAEPGLVKARTKNGKVPPKDYHVVSLAKRHRSERLPSSGEPKRHVRLHFRRGHWRHYETHRIWIKWMLVGDPDLGFVDKHYRL